MNYPVVIVEWDDAHASHDDISPEDAVHVEPYRTISVGFLIARNEHGVVLGYDLHPNDPNIQGYSFIPNGMIVDIKEGA